MKKLGLFGLLLVSLLSCSKSKNNEVQYTVTRIHMDSLDQLKIEMSFPASKDGTTVLEYPDKAWGQEDLHQALQGMSLRGVDGQVEVNKDSGWIVLQHPKDLKELKFEYLLQQDFENPITSRKTYRPIIQPEYFHVFSHNLFMLPKAFPDSIDVHIQWEGLREDEVVHNSFGSRQRQQKLRNISKERFAQAIFVGGDFLINEILVKENMVYLATRGDWIPFTVDDMVGLLQKTLECQRNFWEDHSQSYFTVTMQPIFSENGSSYQGTGITNSFATSFSNNKFLKIDQMVHLFNHELMHNWIGGKIKNKDEEQQYWFSEGFTEYYAFKNVARNHINGFDEGYLIRSINETIKNLYGLSIKEVPNSEMNYKNFWSNWEYQRLPYYRGALFAFYLDRSIMDHSKGKYSLDNVMKDILNEVNESQQKLNHTFFMHVLGNYLPATIEDSFQNYIVKGKLLPLAAFFDAQDLQYQSETAMFELGFELSVEDGVVMSVTEGSAAQKAGIRPGDIALSRSIWYGNTKKTVEMQVKRGDRLLDFTFLPVRMQPIPTLVNSDKNREILRF